MITPIPERPVLATTCVHDEHRTIRMEDLPDLQPEQPLRLTGTTPILERLWRLALGDCELNLVEGDGLRYFGAGDNFSGGLFTRDISFSGVLGLNRVYPELMWDSLEATRMVRRRLGFRVPRGYAARTIDVAWEEIDQTREAFQTEHGTAPVIQRTDDVVWLWCAGDLLQRCGHPRERMEWVFATGTSFFLEFYEPWFDPDDGLYRGQATFVDIHFLNKVATGYPRNWSPTDCVLIKALSTNCLYVFGLQAMADLARRLGRAQEAAAWQQRRDALAMAIRCGFDRGDGTLAYFKHVDGRLEPRRDATGSALAVLAGVVTGEDARRALADYPVTGRGVPLFHPFFAENDWYHNHSSWPFVDTLFCLALEQVDGVDRTAWNLALLARTCVNDDLVGRWKFDAEGKLRDGYRYDPGSFHELLDYRSGQVKGSANQLWTAAAFIGTCFRAGLVGT